MNNKNQSGREKQKQIALIIIILFFVAIFLTAVISSALDKITFDDFYDDDDIEVSEEESSDTTESTTEINAVEDTSATNEENTNSTKTDTDDNVIAESTETTDEETSLNIDTEDDNTLTAATVQGVVDGKTITVETEDRTFDVALIGITAINEDNAVAYLEKTVPVGTTVYLLYDESSTDMKGDDLCYVWLTDSPNFSTSSSVKSDMLNGLMLVNGVAEPLSEYPNSRYDTIFSIIYANSN